MHGQIQIQIAYIRVFGVRFRTEGKGIGGLTAYLSDLRRRCPTKAGRPTKDLAGVSARLVVDARGREGTDGRG
jgi:hypothetical protein